MRFLKYFQIKYLSSNFSNRKSVHFERLLFPSKFFTLYRLFWFFIKLEHLYLPETEIQNIKSERKGRMVQSKRYATLLIIFLLALHSQVSEAQETGSFVTINKAEIYFEEHGSGEPLLLLHGFINSGRQYSTIIPELVEKYRVIVPDFRGHGYSTNPEKIFTHKQFADDMFALLEHLGIDEYSAIGYSSGRYSNR